MADEFDRQAAHIFEIKEYSGFDADDLAEYLRAAFVAGRKFDTASLTRLKDARELKAARAVCEAVAEFIASRGKIQERTPLHDALAQYYRTLAAASAADRKESGEG